jgi:hypothetical protein
LQSFFIKGFDVLMVAGALLGRRRFLVDNLVHFFVQHLHWQVYLIKTRALFKFLWQVFESLMILFGRLLDFGQ